MRAFPHAANRPLSGSAVVALPLVLQDIESGRNGCSRVTSACLVTQCSRRELDPPSLDLYLAPVVSADKDWAEAIAP
jgi:hypothetical protein